MTRSKPSKPAPLVPVIIRRDDILAAAGISFTVASRLEREGKFPRRRKLTDKTSGWLYTEVLEWARAQPVSDLRFGGEQPTRRRRIKPTADETA